MNSLIKILKKKILRDAGLVYFGALLNGLSLLLINLILGRYLDKNIFGIFTLSVLVLSTVAEMSDFGLNGALLRFAPYYLINKQENKLKQLVKTIWKWRVWMSVILTTGGMIMSPLIARYVFNRSEISIYLIFSFLGVGGVVLLGFISAYLQAKEKFSLNVTIQSLKGLLRLFLIIILYFLGVKNIYAYLSIYILIPWVLFLLTYKELPEKFMSVVIEQDVKEKMNSELAKFSFWLTLWSFSAILSSRVDQAMLSHLMGLNEVAVYAMAFQFVLLYVFAIQAITSVLMPKINSQCNNGDMIKLVKKIWKWIIPLALLISIAIYPSKFVIGYVFGAKYIESIPVYLILSYSMVVNLIGIPLSLIISAFNKTQLIAYSGFAQLIVNVVLNFLLIPKYGVLGAGMTFAVGIVLSFMYNLVSAAYLLKFKEIKVA